MLPPDETIPVNHESGAVRVELVLVKNTMNRQIPRVKSLTDSVRMRSSLFNSRESRERNPLFRKPKPR